ncbi:hypothetical protein PoB_000876900 [Plakobranchus ocellatus]|uniref:Uncharacterized protein n=1 Tax=Plakobranchus ocellatus TaxID=259542 RepID=A0AAV3YJ08_9GAST|nr:hypothetical protein PoB_000876900 [Plakobranchus ocellatus]
MPELSSAQLSSAQLSSSNDLIRSSEFNSRLLNLAVFFLSLTWSKVKLKLLRNLRIHQQFQSEVIQILFTIITVTVKRRLRGVTG